MFDFNPDEKWQVVSAAIQAAGTVVTLMAAIAAWVAAVASKRAVNEMAAARHQYVKPVLVFRERGPITIDLNAWRGAGSGFPDFDARFEIKNVGKGPAFGVVVDWMFRGQQRTEQVPIDVDAINRMLASSALEVTDDRGSWDLRHRDNTNHFWRIGKSDFMRTTVFDRIEEGEVVYLNIPDDVLGLQVLHSLNKMANETDHAGRPPGYAQPDYWEGKFCDKVSVRLRSITDSQHSMSYVATPRLGISRMDSPVQYHAQLRVSL